MRLTDSQIQSIRQVACQVAGKQSRARRGSCLMLELQEPVDNPALLAAQISAQVSRAMQGRKVDVLLCAPDLMRLPIHDIAFKEGQLL